MQALLSSHSQVTSGFALDGGGAEKQLVVMDSFLVWVFAGSDPITI